MPQLPLMQTSQQLQQRTAAAPSAAPTTDEDDTGEEVSESMPEQVFKWMAHTVNQDFVGLGYQAILTKSGDQEFVNLCQLIKNCSSVLTLLKARRRLPGDDEDDVKGDARSAAANTSASSAGIQITRRKRRKWALFSSKQHRRTTARGQQQQHKDENDEQSIIGRDGLYESMARKMRKDTERIIRRTSCLDLQAPLASCPPSPYPVGSKEQLDFAFMYQTWRSFRKLAQSRILEYSEMIKRSQELQQEVTSLTQQLEQQRAAQIASASSAEDPTSLTNPLAVGRLQRVGGFLRRAVSKERLTFGRKPKVNDFCSGDVASSTTDHHTAVKRSRSCSLPPCAPLSHPQLPIDPEFAMRRMRTEFERRERCLLSERDKLRQINSKLNFRVQHLSSMAAAAKQNGSNSGGGGSGSVSGKGCGGCGSGSSARCSSVGKDSDFHHRRLERRIAALQKEVASLKQELNEKIDSLTSIGAAVAKLSWAAAAAAPEDKVMKVEQVMEVPTDVAHVPQLVDSVCHSTLNRLHRLRQARQEALARTAGLGDSLNLVQRRLGLTRAAMENTHTMEVELEAIAARLAVYAGSRRSLSVNATRRCSFNAGRQVEDTAPAEAAASTSEDQRDQQKLELRDRIIGKLTAMLRERQDEVRRLKEISISSQDISSRSCLLLCGLGQVHPPSSLTSERKSRAFDTRSGTLR